VASQLSVVHRPLSRGYPGVFLDALQRCGVFVRRARGARQLTTGNGPRTLSLARGPAEDSAPQDVDVQMVNGLAGERPGIDHRPVAVRFELPLACQLRSHG